jgi:TRAP transporter 4TM/12TM fusion protein
MEPFKRESFFECFLAAGKISPATIRLILISLIAVYMGFYHLFTAYFGEPTALAHRSAFLTFIMVLTFFLHPLRGNSRTQAFWGLFPLDALLILLAVGIEVYILYDLDELQLRWGAPTRMDTLVGSAAIFLVLEATRRTVGWPMVIITGFFILHTVFGNYFPGLLNSPPTPWIRFVDVTFSDIALFSLPLMVVSSFIILFLLFSSFLIRTGAGNFFINLAYSIAGRLTGGPAKTAVLASAFMGTLSGSGVANVVATGSFTIPLMKSVGYRPLFAGAVETVASTGGILMPPIMGAAAFIIAQFLSIPYLQVCIHALIPAVLYFTSVMMMVHFEAKKEGLRPIDKKDLPSFRKTLAGGGHLLIAVVALILFLARGYTEMMAAFWAILCLLLFSSLKKETRLNPVGFLSALEEGSRAAVTVGMACACAGIIIGSVYISGLGMKFAHILVMAAGGELWLTLLYVMIASIILGMGMPATAVYLTLVTIVVPALLELGVEPIAAHLFCFYFGCISAITPPVCLAAFAAGAISGANPMRTGFTACRIGIAAFIVPFMFVYDSSMLMIGRAPYVLWVLCTAVCGIVALSAGVEGWLLRRATIPERAGLVMASLVLIKPGLLTDAVGFGLFGTIIGIQKIFPYSAKVDDWFSGGFRLPRAWFTKDRDRISR